MAETTVPLTQLMDERYTQRMGVLVAEAEKRCVAAEIERDYYAQQLQMTQQRVGELENHIEAMHAESQEAPSGEEDSTPKG